MKEFIFEPKGIYYRINIFQPERQTLVFVHGLSGSSSAWFPYEKELEDSFNILSFDLRGHGKSVKPRNYEAYKIENFANDLNELLTHLRIEKCALVSHSLGSLVALAFLDMHLSKVSKIILLAPHYSVRGMVSAKTIKPFLAVSVPLLKLFPFSLKIRGHVDYSRFLNTGDWNIPRMVADINNTSLRVYLYATKQTFDFDGGNVLGKISVPTLVMHGDRDTIFPQKYGMLVASKISGAKFVSVKNSDHILVLNNSKEILEEIKNFVV